jgi:hypothetical protein
MCMWWVRTCWATHAIKCSSSIGRASPGKQKLGSVYSCVLVEKRRKKLMKARMSSIFSSGKKILNYRATSEGRGARLLDCNKYPD